MADYVIPEIVVGIAGGSGSGKTTLGDAGREHYGAGAFSLDAYYRDLGHLPQKLRDRVNFDEPSALELDLAEQHLTALRIGNAIQQPVYHFGTHTRTGTKEVRPTRIMFIDHILALHLPRGLFDFTVFVNTGIPRSFWRRMVRDVTERDRTPWGVIAQYATTVLPGQYWHVRPTRKHADVIINGNQPKQKMITDFYKALEDRFGERLVG